MSDLALKQRIRDESKRLGFDRIAFVRAGPCRDGGRLEQWLAEGRHGEMRWMARGRERRTDPGKLLPGARTVVTLLTFYGTSPAGEAARWAGRVSRYAWGVDYHNLLRRRMRKLVRAIDEAAPGSRTVTAVDYRPILEKEWAERAGLGWIGKHTNLITEDRGSWFFLSELVTDLDLAEGEKPHAERCGKCTKCIEACPTGAIVAPWVVDARRCISYLTIELKGPIPLELRPLVGEWIFGCDVCQDVCPWNRFAVPVTEPRFQLDEGKFRGELTDFLGLDEETFRKRFEGSPVRRAGRDGFLRNVCVALGNRGERGALPALRATAEGDPSALVREHARWAIERIETG
ncbi:MAG: tRNA epoxyqueuosine(34) reductase QueG, partial [bacterium]